MGATIVEVDAVEVEADELDTVDTTAQADGQAAEGNTGADELPEKYRGKSVAEIVRMHQEAEKLVGKQGQELGDLRKVADSYILKTLGGDNQSGARSAPAEEQIDFFVDPAKAVEQMIQRDPRIKSAEQAAEMVRRENALRNLQAKHPDAMEVAQSDDFQAWVAESKVRQKLFAQADQAFDFEAAEELIGTYKSLRPKAPAQAAAPATKADNKAGKMMPRAVTGGSDEVASSKKIYRRADIIRLQQVDPNRYMDLQPEIMQAYREGRVR